VANKSYEHALALYNELFSKSGHKSGHQGKFVGSITEAFRAISVSQSYYTPLFRTLKELGCIEVLVAAHGGGRRKSEVLLHFPPDPDEFAEMWRLTKRKASAIMEQQQRIDIIERRLPDIDIATWIASTELRLEVIEQQLREVQRLGT